MNVREPEKKYNFLLKGGHIIVAVINSRIVDAPDDIDPKDVK